MKILALDLGTNTGFAHDSGAGTWKLATAKEITAWGKSRLRRRCDPRMQRLSNLLVALPKPDIVVFEDVEFSTSTGQTQLWASYRATVWLSLGERCHMECVPVSTLKKFATGSGSADKPAMAAALFKQQPELKSAGLDDNAVDAIWLYSWAVQNLSRMKI